MNICLINHYAGAPQWGMEYRPYYLAREWVRSGHSVTVVAASYAHVRSAQPPRAGTLSESRIDGIRYLWLRTPKYSGNNAGRALNMFAFVMQLFRHQAQIALDCPPDVVVASSTYPLDIYPAARLANRFGAKLAFEVHDLWPLSPIELGGMSPRHPFMKLMAWAEGYAYRRSDKVISMLPLAAPYMESRGMRADKFVYIPNGVDITEWRIQTQLLPPEHVMAIQREREAGRCVIGYAGAHGVANALENLVRTADLLRNDSVAIVLVGQGPEKPALARLSSQLGLRNLHFLDPVGRQAVPELLNLMDILYIGLQSQPLFRFGVSPNKLMDYMMAGKPILNAVAAGNDPVADARCGLSVKPDDPNALAEAVRELVSLTAAEREALGANGRNYIRQHHDYRDLARWFLEAVA